MPDVPFSEISIRLSIIVHATAHRQHHPELLGKSPGFFHIGTVVDRRHNAPQDWIWVICYKKTRART